MSQNVFDRIEDAPPPKDDTDYVYVDRGKGWLTHYVARDGKWIEAGTIYPAQLD